MIGKEQSPDIGKATQFQPGESGNPDGKPKGSLNWSNVVKNLLEDEALAEKLLKSKPGYWNMLKRKDGANLIVTAMMVKAISGDKQAADWLRKTGFGDKFDLSVTNLEAAQASVEELAEQDDNVGKWAENKLAEATPRPNVAPDAPIQDQEQRGSTGDVPAESDTAEVPGAEGNTPLQPDSKG